MLRKADCRKYRKWKEEQSKKLKKTKEKVKERKHDESATDCIDEDDDETRGAKPVTKINYRRCKKKRKKKKPPRLMRKIVKHIPSGELILKCVKPSVEDRLYVLNARHNACLGLSQSKIDFVLEDTRTPTSELFYMPERRKRHRRRRPCGKKRTEESESDDSECDSVCSFDSEVCLADVKLTSKDKEEIKKLQRET